MWWPNWLRLIGLPNVAIYLTRNGKYPRKRELWYYWCLGKHLECLPFCDTHIIYSKKRQLRWWRSSFFTLKLMRRAQVVEVSRYWWTSGRRMAHVLQNYVRILSDYKKSLFLRVGWNPQGFRKLFLWLLLPWHLFPGFGNHRWKSPEFWLQKCRSLTSFSSSEKDAKFEVCWSVVCCRDPLHWRISSNHFKEHCNW